MSGFKRGDRVRVVKDDSMYFGQDGRIIGGGARGFRLVAMGERGDKIAVPESWLISLEPAETPSPTPDPISPHAYSRYAIQPIDFILKNNLPFDIGCVVKYALRYDAKDGVQDLKKAIRNLQFRINLLEGREITEEVQDA